MTRQQPPESSAPGERPASETPARADETRIRRGVRYTHRTALYAAVAIMIVAGIYLILLITRNARHVRVDYVFGTAHARLVWLVIVSALTGWILGLATSYLLRRRTRRPR